MIYKLDCLFFVKFGHKYKTGDGSVSLSFAAKKQRQAAVGIYCIFLIFHRSFLLFELFYFGCVPRAVILERSRNP